VDGQGIGIKFAAGADTSLFFTAPRKRSKTHPAYYPMGTASPLTSNQHMKLTAQLQSVPTLTRYTVAPLLLHKYLKFGA
jgi:hypothetical protein